VDCVDCNLNHGTRRHSGLQMREDGESSRGYTAVEDSLSDKAFSILERMLERDVGEGG